MDLKVEEEVVVVVDGMKEVWDVLVVSSSSSFQPPFLSTIFLRSPVG